jgi:hypothetical protein
VPAERLSWTAVEDKGDGVEIVTVPAREVRAVPFGKYWRRRPLVFSLVPRIQGECGLAK